jgi:hypothetical protein
MATVRYPKRPPELAPLVRIPDAHGLRYVVTGSVAALLYGVELVLGDFDVVPTLAGDFEMLSKSAVQRTAFGVQVQVAHVDEVLARLTVPRRQKDIHRVHMLREVQRLLRLTSLD